MRWGIFRRFQKRFFAGIVALSLITCYMPVEAVASDIEEPLVIQEQVPDNTEVILEEAEDEVDISADSEEMLQIQVEDDEKNSSELLAESGLKPYPRYSGGNGTEESPFLISSYSDLKKMQEYYANPDEYVSYYDTFPYLFDSDDDVIPDNFRLTTDIYFPSAEPWTAIRRVNTFDGNGHTFYGIVFEADEEYATSEDRAPHDSPTALFTDAGYIKNLTLSDITVRFPKLKSADKASCSAYLFAFDTDIISDCTIKGPVKIVNENSAEAYTASVFLMACKVDEAAKNCRIEGKITAENLHHLYGICGGLGGGGIVSDCSIDADITMNGGAFTGIVSYFQAYSGESGSKIEHCTTAGRIVNYDMSSGVTACEGDIVGMIRSGEHDNFVMSDCVNTADIYSYNGAAAFCAFMETDTIKDCVNEGNISSLKQVAAGICLTSCDSLLENCVNRGNIQGNMEAFRYDWFNSGISCGHAGYHYGDLSFAATKLVGCVNEGNVSGYKAAGIYGELDEGDADDGSKPSIEKCENNGDITAVECAGGILGNGNSSSVVRYSKNTGKVTATMAAGIAGRYSGSMFECANRGEIKGLEGDDDTAFLGGLVGDLDYDCVIQDCYSAGTISGIYSYTSAGGLFGRASGPRYSGIREINNCYSVTKLMGDFGSTVGGITGLTGYDGSVAYTGCHYLKNNAYSGIGRSADDSGISANTDAEMKLESTYRLWDFGSIWIIGAEEDYPYPIFAFDGIVITFNCNGGTIGDKNVITKRTNSLGKITSLPTPKYRGMKFLGWFTAKSGGELITRDTVFEGPVTVYAHWEEDPNWGTIAISEQSPADGVRNLDAKEKLVISFQTGTKVVRNMEDGAGRLRIFEKQSGKEVYTSDGSTSISIVNRWLGSLVKITPYAFRLSPSCEYYIVIEDGFLVGEEDSDMSVVCDKGEWSFATGAKVRYRDEQKTHTDALLPYVFDWSAVDFSISSFKYNWELSMIAYGMTLSAFDSYRVFREGGKEYGCVNAEEFLTQELGFSRDSFAYNEGYRYPPKVNTIGVCAATKKIDVKGKEYTFIAVPIRGAGYEAEWASNVRVGTGDTHEGFNNAADQVIEFLKDYIVRKSITGDVKILVTGYSRAGGTTNLVTAKIDDGVLDVIPVVRLDKQDFYGFCF